MLKLISGQFRKLARMKASKIRARYGFLVSCIHRCYLEFCSPILVHVYFTLVGFVDSTSFASMCRCELKPSDFLVPGGLSTPLQNVGCNTWSRFVGNDRNYNLASATKLNSIPSLAGSVLNCLIFNDL